MTDHTPYTVPKEPGGFRAAALAIAVHAALLAFFWIGIDWQSETPVSVKAEIWDMQAREAAPIAPPPEPVPQPKPVPQPEPKPEPKVEPKSEPETPPPPKVDIALEREKKRKEEERKEKLAALEREKKEKAEKEKAEQAKQAKLKEEADKKKKAEQQKQAELDKKKADQQKAEAEQKKKEAADEKRRAEARAEEMRRLTGAVGSGGSGQAEKSTGSGRADASYLQKIGAKIRSNTVFNVPETLSGNPAVEFDVELLPDGTLRGIKLRKSSGVSGFDEAVKRAIERSQPFPRDDSGTVPSRFTVVHKPKDQ